MKLDVLGALNSAALAVLCSQSLMGSDSQKRSYLQEGCFGRRAKEKK